MQNKDIQVSVVMPCLNEQDGIASCIGKINKVFQKKGIKGEIIVVDNGSTDNTAEIAKSMNARVVYQPRKGYGNAYLKGLMHARGENIVMGDADDSYDFLEMPKFLSLLQNYDFVIGSRYAGHMEKGAMPLLHKYVGNPFFSRLLRLLFKIKISDSHCGFGAIRKSALEKLELKSQGMEFASEIVIEAFEKLRVEEIPISYYRRKGKSKLRPFKDGMRHLTFIMRRYFNS